ncbi:hypothetical protein BH23ACT9_BH23ACT9_21780 [soil metagenome]
MASPEVELRSPVLANVTVLVGFALIFTTFATDTPWSWIIGGGMVIAGGLWAGFSGSVARTVPSDAATATPDAPEAATPPAAEDRGDGTEGREAPHGPGTGGQSHGRTT